MYCICSIYWASSCFLGDFLQLPPVRGKPIYVCVGEHDKIDRPLRLNLWHMFQLAELTKVMRQKGNAEFINLLRLGLEILMQMCSKS